MVNLSVSPVFTLQVFLKKTKVSRMKRNQRVGACNVLTYDIIRNPTDADGCRRMPTDADGCRRMPTDADGCRRMPTDADGCRRMPTDADGCRRMPTDADGLSTGCRRVAHGFPTVCSMIAEGLPTDADGCRRTPTDTDGHRRTPTDTDGRKPTDGSVM